jgi:hypothetical protein
MRGIGEPGQFSDALVAMPDPTASTVKSVYPFHQPGDCVIQPGYLLA